MSDVRYRVAGHPLPLTAAEAIHAVLLVRYSSDGRAVVLPPAAADCAIMAIFAVMTDSQQERALQRLGVERVPA